MPSQSIENKTRAHAMRGEPAGLRGCWLGSCCLMDDGGERIGVSVVWVWVKLALVASSQFCLTGPVASRLKIRALRFPTVTEHHA